MPKKDGGNGYYGFDSSGLEKAAQVIQLKANNSIGC